MRKTTPEDFGITGIRENRTKGGGNPELFPPDGEGFWDSPYGNHGEYVRLNGRAFGRAVPPDYGIQGALFGERETPARQALIKSPGFGTWGDEKGVTPDVLPPPDVEAKYGDYGLTLHRDDGNTTIHAWHQGRSVGKLEIGDEPEDYFTTDEYGERNSEEGPQLRKTPNYISVRANHRKKGLGRAMFRFAQFTGVSGDPQKNLTHSDTQTSFGQKYSQTVPDNPDEDPSVIRPSSRNAQFRLWG